MVPDKINSATSPCLFQNVIFNLTQFRAHASALSKEGFPKLSAYF